MLTCTPSYALYLAETMGEMGIDPNRDLQLRYGLFGAEPWTDQMRTEIERALGIRATDIYGLSEIIGPGVAYECAAQQGLHVAEDHFLVEVINPQTGEVLPEGAQGELVFTTITKEGIPMVRYRTRDLSSLDRSVCACGRTHARMHRILGRSDDMLIIRGVNVFPSQVESVLLRFTEVAPHYQLVVEREHNLDRLEVWVEMEERFFSDEVRRIEEVRSRITADLESTLGISVYLRLVEPKTIVRSEGKAKRVIDNRKK
jgi:phenylacetate-CoA ligase